MIKRIFINLQTAFNKKESVVKYSKGKFTKSNIGDALNIYLFEKIFDKNVVNYKEVMNIGLPPVYSFIGSVLDNSAVRNLTVMGSGFKSSSSPMPKLPKRVLSCRGPLTREKLINLGMKNVPEVYGDPAILLPNHFDIKVNKKYKMGLIPHYTDQDSDLVKYYNNNEDVKIIDVFSPMEKFVEDIKSCEFTMSSSLHGIILSHAYKVPSGWMKLSENLVGGSFKFDDYYQSLGSSAKPVIFDIDSTLNSLANQAEFLNVGQLAEKLQLSFKNFKIH